MKKKIIKGILFTVSFFLLNSCNLIRFKIASNKIDPSIYKFENGEKEILFIEMVPVAPVAFYENVRNEVMDAKIEGYALLYEGIRSKYRTNNLKLKLRRVLGYIPNSNGLEPHEAKDFDAVQDNKMFLRIVNDKDYNIDLTAEDIVREYEKQFGDIKLTPNDYNTPLNQRITPEPIINTQKITYNYRNKKIADYITKSSDNRFVVVYNIKYRKGLFEELQNKNPSWKISRYKYLNMN